MQEKIRKIATDSFTDLRKTAWRAESERFAKKCLKDLAEPIQLTPDEKNEIIQFYRSCGYKVNTVYHQLFYTVTGEHNVNYLPDWMLSCELNRKLNDQRMIHAWTDKNYLERIIPEANCPFALIRNVNGMLFDHNFTPISTDDADKILASEENVIVKPSVDSGGGMNIELFKSNTAYANIQEKFGINFIVQRVLKQSKSTAVFNETSVNTIRIISLLWQNEVYICGIILRAGIRGAITDNTSRGQGMSLGLKPDGMIKDVCYSNEGLRYKTSEYFGIAENHRVASVDKAVEFVKYTHQRLPYSKLVAWDIAVNEDDTISLIEYNTKSIGIHVFQYGAGPLFGDLTKEVLTYYGRNSY